MEQLGLLLVGAVLIVLGSMNWRGNISTIHWYNRTKVTGDDIPKYGRAVGLGCMLMGAALVLAALLGLFLTEEVTAAVVLVGAVAGLALILYGQFKYNKGIF